jgi:hypothetical protein
MRSMVEGAATRTEPALTKLYFTFTPAPNPFAPNANPRFFGKDIPVPSHRPYSHPIRFARTKSTANDA